MSIKMKDLLKIKEFKNSKVIAGLGGLDEKITSITVAEVPDSALWLKSGELVLTTGYFIGKNEEFQIEWINSLIDHGASALAIKTDRFIVKLATSTIDLANSRKFPIIELPSGIIWPTLIEAVMNEISNYQQKIIDITYRIHNELTSLVAIGSGIKPISDTISGLVSNMIIVEDLFLNVLAISYPNNKECKLYSELSRMILDESYRDSRRNSNYYKSVYNCQEIDIQKLNGFKNITNVGDYKKVSLPIIADSMVFGFVSLVEIDKTSSDLDLIALEHGSTVIAFELMREEMLINNTLKEKKSFLNYLLGYTNNPNQNIYYRSKYNFSFSRPIVVIYIELDIEYKQIDYKLNVSNKIEIGIRNILKELLYSFDTEGFYVSDGGTIEVLAHFDNKLDYNIVIDSIRCFCSQFIKTISNEFNGINYNIGVSGIHYELNTLKKSYEESKRALEIGKTFQKENKVHFYDEQGFYKILYSLDNREVISEYCNGIIGLLIQDDIKNNSDNYNLLKSYIFNDSNLTKTATMNYLHPNTLAYRLKKIETILNVDLKDVNDKFNIYIAFILQRIL